MTGLEKIVDQIREAAKQEAQAVIDKANEEANAIKDESRKKAETKAKEIIEAANKSALDAAQRRKANAELSKRQSKLEIKQELIQSTIEMAQEAVVKLPDEEYFKLFSSMANNITFSGDAVLHLNEKDHKRLGAKFVESFPKKLNVVLEPATTDIIGGFLLWVGKTAINCSVESLFERNNDQFSDLINKILFEN